MIFIGKYDELVPGRGYGSIKDHLSPTPYEGQNRVILYLKSGQEDLYSPVVQKDVFTGKVISLGTTGRHDGTYTWWDVLAYYVEVYNLRLPKDFEDHILSRSPVL